MTCDKAFIFDIDKHTVINEHFTFGYRKSPILISLLNAVILLMAVGAIVIESIHKFSEPVEVNGITHTTLELELPDCHCHDQEC